MSYLDIEFPWYRNGIKSVKPSGLITLKQFINAVISPKPSMLKAFEDIAEAGRLGDLKLKDDLKTTHLFFTTPSVKVYPIRRYDSITEFLPFAVVEYDKIEHAELLRDYIFNKHKSCIFAFLSPSRTGCKFIFFIDTPKSVDDYKELYFGLVHDLDKFKNLDLSNQRCVLPLFNSYDPNAKFREDAIQSSKRGYKIDTFDESCYDTESANVPYEERGIQEGDIEEVFNRLRRMFNKIEVDGHGHVLKYSFSAGGFSAYYGIEAQTMLDFLEELIENNNYLSKGTKGYIRTAHQMFNKGYCYPTKLLKNDD